MRPRRLIPLLLLLAALAAGCASARGTTDGYGTDGYGTTAPPTTNPAGNPTSTAAAAGDYSNATASSAADDNPAGRPELRASGFTWNRANLAARHDSQVALTVRNADQALHNFTLQAAGISKDLPAGKTGTIRFTAPAPGTYQFYCQYHRGGMTGTLTVR